MSESLIYWITRLDGIHNYLHGFSVFFTIATIMCSVLFAVGYIAMKINIQYGENDVDYQIGSMLAKLIKYAIPSFILMFAFDVGHIFIPTTKEMIAVKVLPKIATTENVSKLQNISKDMLDVTAKWLEELKNKKN